MYFIIKKTLPCISQPGHSVFSCLIICAPIKMCNFLLVFPHITLKSNLYFKFIFTKKLFIYLFFFFEFLQHSYSIDVAL